jgi:hypothetical protein
VARQCNFVLVGNNSIVLYRLSIVDGMEYNINRRSLVAPGLMPLCPLNASKFTSAYALLCAFISFYLRKSSRKGCTPVSGWGGQSICAARPVRGPLYA